MYKLCQTEQSILRQRQIEDGLQQLLLHRRYEDISVSDLCQHMDIPRKSFYRYFSGKEGVLYAMIDHKLTDFFQMPVPEHKSRGNAVGDLDLFFLFWYENREFLDALMRSDLSGILVERANRFALHEGMLPRNLKNEPVPVQGLAMSFAVSGLLAMTFAWHRQGFAISPEEMTRLATTMLTSPLLNV